MQDVRMYTCRCCGEYDYCNVILTPTGEIDEQATDNAPRNENIGYCRNCGPDPVEEPRCSRCADLRR